jgi:alpha-ketoglutarate-dependent 2,4-dichlorophenoxyacetate dioxygenase
MLEITPVNEHFVAEIAGVDLCAAPTAELSQALRAALEKYAVLVIPNQPLNEAQQLQIAQVFGPLETSIGASIYNAKRPRRLDHAQLSDISNLDESGQILEPGDIRRLINLSNQLWHTDSSFKPVPASASLLAAQEVPPVGGATEFADMRAAWDALDADTQARIGELIAVHDYFYSRSLTGFDLDGIPPEWRTMQPPVQQVLVRTQPGTQRRSLYLASHIKSIVGMADEEGRELIDRLMAVATQRQYVYRHRWRTDDLVIWDNRTTMHRGTRFDEKYRRAMRRATAQDIGPTVAL